MIWACFLHFYQPPTQKKYWVDRVTDESYRRIVKGLLENPQARITLNINSVLCELWDQYNHHDVLSGLRELVHRGQVELTGSAKYHPLLPKLPPYLITRQIVLNEVTLNKYFGVVGPVLENQVSRIRNQGEKERAKSTPDTRFMIHASDPRLRGFFPPEMAYNRYLAEIVAGLGYEWLIAEELSLGKPVDYSRIYTVSGVTAIEFPLPGDSGDSLSNRELMIFFRDRGFSYKVLAGYLGTEKLFLDELAARFPQSDASYHPEHFLLTAMDGETFGHHRPGMERLLFDLFKIPSIKMVHISDLPGLFSGRESVETVPSTWALMEHEVERKLPFARWDDPENEVHRLQWQLTNLAIETAQNAKIKMQNDNSKLKNLDLIENWKLKIENSDPNAFKNEDLNNEEKAYLKAQLLLDRALHSDQYWWASAKPWWSIEYIERGARELLNAVDALPGAVSQKQEAKSLYYRILETAFEYQRSGKVDEISHREDETIRMRTDQALPKMPKEELLKIIERIRSEMLDVASRQEYERATQLRDRINELRGYLSE